MNDNHDYNVAELHMSAHDYLFTIISSQQQSYKLHLYRLNQ